MITHPHMRASVEELRAVFRVLDEIMADMSITSDMYRHVQEAKHLVAVLIVQREGV